MADLEVRAGLLTATPLSACGWEFTVAPDGPDDEQATFVWEFGDDQSAGTLGPAATHSYAADGHRHVSLTVVAPDRADRSAAVEIVVAGCGESLAPGSSSAATLLVPGTLLPLLGAALAEVAIAADLPRLLLSSGCLGLGGLVFLVGWAASAAAVTPPSLMQTMHCLHLHRSPREAVARGEVLGEAEVAQVGCSPCSLERKRTLPGMTSRWTRPSLWAASSALAI